MPRSSVFGLMALLAAGCTGPGDPDRLENAGSDLDLSFKISTFYNTYAQEGGFNCPGVQMDGITRSRVVEREGDRVELAVTYFFMTPALPESLMDVRCNGFRERMFTLVERTDGRYDVVAMTGEQRGGL